MNRHKLKQQVVNKPLVGAEKLFLCFSEKKPKHKKENEEKQNIDVMKITIFKEKRSCVF